MDVQHVLNLVLPPNMPWPGIFLFLARLLPTDSVCDAANLGVHAGTNGDASSSALGHDRRRVDEVEAVADRYVDLFATVCIGVLCN